MIETVLGPVRPDEVRRVDAHQHLLSDAAALSRPGVEPTPADPRVVPDNLAFLRWNALALPDNLRLDDPAVAAEELGRVEVDLVVECTSLGLGPDHAGLPGLSRAAGVHVVAAYGLYVDPALPSWARDLDEDAVEALLRTALLDAVPGTSFRAGLVGIMGTTAPLTPVERARLRAAGRAALAAGAAVSVRLDETAREGLQVLAELVAVGLPADRVVLTNADEWMDAAYWHDLLDAGAVLEMCFGTEAQHWGRMRNPSDGERLDFFERFVRERPAGRFLLGGSLWTKSQLRRHGGPGYDHLTARVLPELRRRGLPDPLLDPMLREEPLRLLDRPATPGAAA